MSKKISRRTLLKSAAASGIGLLLLRDSKMAFGYGANDKLNVAIIGCGGKGDSNLNDVAGNGQNIVALCDVNANEIARHKERFPNAKVYADFRVMLDQMGKEIDAVVVSTPDHTHAPASITAMQMGKHVYCEKPLTHTISEARLMRETARKYKVATQMGNQGTAGDGFREAVEVIKSGALGNVYEVHVWSNRPVWPQGINRPTEAQAIPKELDWDLWLGPAAKRPYNSAYCPFNWRGWIDFGTGALGDMGCHTLNMAFMALDLRNPISVEAEVFEMTEDSYPKRSIIEYMFPERNGLRTLRLKWYDGSLKPPADLLYGRDLPGSGVAIIGDKGRLFSPDDYGSSYELLPKDRFVEFAKPKPTLPRSPGHHAEWIRACKGGEPAMSNFDYGSALTETLLLGNLAVVTGETIYWKPEEMKAVNCAKADCHITPTYRKGWEL